MENNHPVKSFVIDRAKWGRGELLGIDGKMCCLGFFSKVCGISDGEMEPRGVPSSAWVPKVPEWAAAAVGSESREDMDSLVSWNDYSHNTFCSARRPRAEAEEAIKKIFAKHGVKVTFRGTAKKKS